MSIIVLVGAPGTGKSTIALALAKQLHIHQSIGTDTIREIMRASIPKDIAPTLHTSAIKAGEYAPPGEDTPIWGFIKQAGDVLPGIQAVVKRATKEKSDLIIEGIHPLPGTLTGEDLIHIVITVPSEEQHITQIAGQGEERSSYKIALFEKARAFQNYLIELAREHDALIVENTTIEETITAIIETL